MAINPTTGLPIPETQLPASGHTAPIGVTDMNRLATQGLQPPQDFWGGVGGFLQGIINPIANFNLQNAMGLGDDSDQLRNPVTPGSQSMFVGQLIDMFNRGEISAGDYAMYNQALADASDNLTMASVIEAARSGSNANIDRMERERLQGRNAAITQDMLRNVNELRARYMPEFEAERSRYQNLLDNPNQIRTDRELGDQLAMAEDSIGEDVRRGREQIGRGMSARGVSSSGKANSLVRGLEERGAAQRSQLLNAAGDTVFNRFQAAQDRAREFDVGLRDAENAANIGDFDRGYSMLGRASQLGAGDYTSPYATDVDLNSLILGNKRANQGMYLDAMLRAGGLMVDAANTGMQAMSSFMPGGK